MAIHTEQWPAPFEQEAYDGPEPGEPEPYEEPETTGVWELIALLVLVIAGIGLPIAGWLTGLALVAQSRVWTTRDAWVAALAPLPVIATAVVWAAAADPPFLLGFGPAAALVLLGGPIAGVVGGAYLTVRAFVRA